MSKKITKDKAKKWADKFRKDGKGASSVMFPKADVLDLLNQEGCEGIRIYNAKDEDTNTYTMFLVGTTADGTNLLPATDFSTAEVYSIWDDGKTCPSICPINDL